MRTLAFALSTAVYWLCTAGPSWAYNLRDADGSTSFGWMVLGVVMATLSLILVSVSSQASGEQNVDYEPAAAIPLAPPVQMLQLPKPADVPEKQLQLAGALIGEEAGEG